mgnify:CR=1 FL=1
MQIKSILAAAVATAFMIQGWSAIAAQGSHNAGEIIMLAAKAAKAVEMPMTPTEDKTEVKPEGAPGAASEAQPMAKPEKQQTTVSVRNTRPRVDPHKDARACLDAGNNEAIIRCAEKYR